ncbi:outer membrane beta-barrel protein [Roseisolibacter sp. H3M3-2]|uniref:outer membrane protein n=1 Tax=Roseisolibacter sp. H3M3-2 TaxID=3031323 RepID=UPI0023DBF0BE|nr:outer membrane beta-barrel protein [Roseisolibacter sp. H3M3-2]MDF1504361.1 outer membrane beta-barrel protein [Roseisolibacter sp. H3M3-2]
MTTLRRILAAVPVALTLTAAAAHAQATTTTRPVSFGLSGGLTLPTGDIGDAVESGYNVGGLLEFARPASPIAFRVEVDYQRFGSKLDLPGAGDLRVISGAANVLYKFAGQTARPYLLGGVGLFNSASTAEDSESETDFGLNLGAGLEVPLSGITVFGDVRYQPIFSSPEKVNLVPIRVGIRF